MKGHRCGVSAWPPYTGQRVLGKPERRPPGKVGWGLLAQVPREGRPRTRATLQIQKAFRPILWGGKERGSQETSGAWRPETHHKGSV